ncbi:MAG: UvrD-helicase domain-containing protein [Planctomycetales bacterium]|nr:UvrD-helicase domain-containing protein [Planctomycetales bacterium]
MQELLEGLTEAQREAVEHVDGPLLIIAGPGSGKTRVVTHRIAHLLARGVHPRGIVALTFTNKSAEEMSRRVRQLAPNQAVWMGTFHRFGAQLLRRFAALVGLAENYSILDVEDSRSVLKRAVDESGHELLYVTPGQIAHAIGEAKSRVISPDQYQPRAGDPHGAIVRDVYPRYQALLRETNAVDFDDLLMLPACMLRDHPELRSQLDRQYTHIMVDEYQDTNLAQYAIVRALSCELPNLAVTGDPDQSIYGWRGATINNILQFENDYEDVRTVKLEQNYRSTRSILRVADELIAHNRYRKPKRLLTDNPEGSRVRLVCYGDQRDEARQIAARIANDLEDAKHRPEEVAIFYRVNALSRSLEMALAAEGVPFQIVHGVEFYQRKEVKDLLAYLHLLNNPRNDTALLRVINSPPRGIGERTVQRLIDHGRQRRLSLLDACREAGAIEKLKGRAAVAVARFVHLIDSLSIHVHRPVEEILGRVVVESGYKQHLESSTREEDQDRIANVDELLSAAREFDEQHADSQLDSFLEQAALVNDVDEWDSGSGRVTLMTLHAAKGLEFDCVYIVGVEQGLLPHERSREELEIEEERRLLFVGITRARHDLQLSYVLRRATRGSMRSVISSPFLVELPRDEMDVHVPPGTYNYADTTASCEAPPGGDWDEYNQLDHQLDEVAEFEQPARDVNDDVPPPDAAPATAVQSAAEMLGETPCAPEPAAPPEAFEHGMMVRHPEYGHGAIIALSGSGLKRQATVRFLGPAGTRTFRLAKSALQPVKGKVR